MSTKTSSKRKRWIGLLLVLFAVGGGAGALFVLLQFPEDIALLFGAILGVEAAFLLWLSLRLYDRIQHSIAESRYQHDRLQRRALVSSGLVLLGSIGFLLYPPKVMWSKTLVLVSIGLLGVYALMLTLITWLLRAELGGRIRYGFAERWIARIAVLSLLGTGFVLSMLFNFLGGIYWWHRHYVTPTKRAEVMERNKLLRSIQITTLHDRDNRPLGLFNRTQSDWNQHYNDPKLLDWKISQAVGVAEGRVDQPAWWWRYLPDGESLKCEPFSIEAFLRVPYYLVKQRRKVGGSTPALQAAKNFLDFGQKRQGIGLFRTVSGKLFDEMPRSYIMCQAFSPREMMAIYLATLWAGQGDNYGLHRLGLYYFDVQDPREFDWNQAVVAAASLPNPGRFNPWYLEACRNGKCESTRRSKVYEVWSKRIEQIKARLRSMGIQVPKELPTFKNGLGRLKAVSHEWQMHDLHIRQWLEKSMPADIQDWRNGARIQLYYDRELTVGKDGQRGLISVAEQGYAPFREQIDDLQLAYTLVDANTGEIASQYGGSGHVDMALAQKPVFGSVFKVLTSLIAHHWPDELPLINRGRKTLNQRRFVYHPWKSNQGHWVRNSHKMPPFVKKDQALAISANIGYVFLSLRWTWMLQSTEWSAIFERGLRHLLEDKKKMSPEEARLAVEKLNKDPVEMRKMFVRDFGYMNYFKDLRENAIFEAAKAATVHALLAEASLHQNTLDAEETKKKQAEEQRKKKRSVDEILSELSPEARPQPIAPAPISQTPNAQKPHPTAPSEPPVTTAQLTEFLDTEPDGIFPASPKIQRTFQEKKKLFEQKFQGPLSLEEIGWVRELRMEIGLRYIAWLAEEIAGFDRKRSGLVPVMTMTLGVSDTDTRQLAAIASFIASGKVIRPALIYRVEREKDIHIPGKPALFPSPLPEQVVASVRKRMSGVLQSDRKGTASGAGQALIKRYGAKILEQAGAKTGTVQSTRGVSCIGFLGHLTGAVTLSTPKNDPLKTFRIRPTFTQKKRLAERLNQLWLKRYQRATEGSRTARLALQRATRYEEQARVLEQQIQQHKQIGKRFFQARKQHNESEKQIEVLQKQRKSLAAKRRNAGHRVTLTQRKIRILTQRKRTLEQQQRSLPSLEQASPHQRKQIETLRNAIAQTNARYQQRLQEYQTAILEQEQWSRQTTEISARIQSLQTQAQQSNAEVLRLKPAFLRGHQPWTLSSSQACRILFDLLSEWKDYSERKAKEEASKPTPALGPSASTSSPTDGGTAPLASPSDAGTSTPSTTPDASPSTTPDASPSTTPDASPRETSSRPDEDDILLPEIPPLPNDPTEPSAPKRPSPPPTIRTETTHPSTPRARPYPPVQQPKPTTTTPPKKPPRIRLPEIFAP